MDISNLSLVALLDLQKRIPAEIKHRETKEKNALLVQVKKMVADHGFSLEDLLSKDGVEAKERKTRAPVKVKYRHPNDASLTWTGRGRTPKWVLQWQADGGKIENLLVTE